MAVRNYSSELIMINNNNNPAWNKKRETIHPHYVKSVICEIALNVGES